MKNKFRKLFIAVGAFASAFFMAFAPMTAYAYAEDSEQEEAVIAQDAKTEILDVIP